MDDDFQYEIGILKRKLLLEELDPTKLTKWITNQIDVQKTKICIFEDKHSRSDMHGKEEMIILLDSLYELENGRYMIKEFCKQNDPYVYRKLFLTTDHHSTEKYKSPIEKPLQYERGGGLQKLYSFWIDISSDQKGMKESQQTDKELRTTADTSDPVDEKAPPKPQNLALSQPRISNLQSHSSEFNPVYNIKKTENDFMVPTVWKFRDRAIVVQVGKLDEIWSDAMVIVRMGRSSPDIPKTIIERVGPQILREFRDKYPFGLCEMEVAVLSGFNLPIWRILYCEHPLNAIIKCVTMAEKLKMRSILFLVQEEHFRVHLLDEVMTGLIYLDSDKPSSSISTIYVHIDQDTLEWRNLRKVVEDYLSTIKVHFIQFHIDDKYVLANPEPKVFNVGHMTVIIQVGKLDEIKSDALVIFEVTKEQWPTQNLPSEILEKTDPMIQKEFKEKFPIGLEYAEVAVLSGYNLPSKKILYGVFPLWPVAWLKQMIEVFFAACFQLASDEGITSIAFMIPSVPYHVAEIYASVLHSCAEMRIYHKPSLSILLLNIVIKDGCTGEKMLKTVFEEEWARRIVTDVYICIDVILSGKFLLMENIFSQMRVFDMNLENTAHGKQGYPSEDIYLEKTLTYSKLPEKSKEGSTDVPQKEVD